MTTKATIPAISILLPTYNGERYLAEQLDSIRAQSFADFELLIVDDGSTDATPDIIAEYARRDDRIAITPSEGNQGQKQRLIQLIEASSAPLIAISDQDDVWAPTKLERLFASLGDAALAFGRSDLIDGEGRSFGKSLLGVLRSPRRSGDRLSLLFRPQVSAHAALARREVMSFDAFRTIHPFDWLIGLVAEFSRGIVYDDAAVVQHRIHGANAHNGGVLLRLNPLLVRPIDFIHAAKRVLGRRVRLIEGLEFLSASPLVPNGERRIFEELARNCRTEWLGAEKHKHRGGYRLRRNMLEKLKPLAGSRRDWQLTVLYVTSLTLGRFHPFTVIRLIRLI